MSNTIDAVCGKGNAVGLKNKIYVVNQADVDSIPDPVLDTDGNPTLKIEGDIVLKTGKVWASWAISPNEQSYKTTSEGDEDGSSKKVEVKFFIPRMSAFKSLVIGSDDPCPKLIIIKDANGEQRLLGDIETGAYTSGDEQTNPKNGYVVTGKYNAGDRFPYFYTGAITT